MVIDHKKNIRVRYLVEIAVLVCLQVFPLTALSSTEGLWLKVNGEWMPGALLIGSTKPEAQVKVLDRALVADKNGRFVFGLGRDVTGQVDIQVTSASETLVKSFPLLSRDYDIQRITGVDKKYVSPPPEVTERIKRDAAKVWKARQIHSNETYFTERFIWPAKGPISGVYGSQRVFNGVPKRPHFGLDIAGPVGTPIFAPAGGVVTLVDDDMFYSGGTLIVDHGYGICSTFIHLSEILVTVGQRISQGDVIAKMGATGRVTGAHLDWRINWFNQRLDPALLLPVRP
nr:M23 family metallopeptidase [Teredinibacter haidensis]